MRRTRIVATIGPASHSRDGIEELLAAGVDVFRLNFSHGSHEGHAAAVETIRGAAGRAGRLVAVMQDLSGPKIRTGRLEDGRPLPLAPGDELRLVAADFVGGPGRVALSSPALAGGLTPGARLLLDDGRIELQVEAVDGLEIRTSVVSGGELGEHKGVNAPGVALPPGALTPKDEDDLRFGVSLGVDLVALSFVRTADDLRHARARLDAAGGSGIGLVAKIERPEAVSNIGSILEACDAVMVARGDLGLEMPLERVPHVQKEMTRLARTRAVPVIVATQVLESMRTEPRPTRAEVSDAAHCVDEGVDAIMLAGETAIGRFPGRTVRTLDAIIRQAEVAPLETVVPIDYEVPGAAHSRALCEAAVRLAAASRADAIVAVTRGGKTARMLSALRPRTPVFAATGSEGLARRLCLLHGVRPIVTGHGEDIDATRAAVERVLLSSAALAGNAVAVFVSVNSDLTRRDANFLDLHRLTPA